MMTYSEKQWELTKHLLYVYICKSLDYLVETYTSTPLEILDIFLLVFITTVATNCFENWGFTYKTCNQLLKYSELL